MTQDITLTVIYNHCLEQSFCLTHIYQDKYKSTFRISGKIKARTAVTSCCRWATCGLQPFPSLQFLESVYSSAPYKFHEEQI